jgi:hypothetical protein
MIDNNLTKLGEKIGRLSMKRVRSSPGMSLVQGIWAAFDLNRESPSNSYLRLLVLTPVDSR